MINNIPFWEVFAHFLIGKGLIFGPKSGLENPWNSIYRKLSNTNSWAVPSAVKVTSII